MTSTDGVEAARDPRLDDEQRLLEAIRAGCREAAEAIVHRHHAGVYRFLLHLTRDPDRADDLTQETFASAWHRIGDFRGRSALGTWLHRIAFGKFVDARRSRLRAEAALAGLRRARPDPPDGDPAGAVLDGERSRRLYEAVQALGEPERVVVVLHYLQGLSLRDVAGVIRCPVGTVKWRTSRALARLRERLAGEFDDAGPARSASPTGNGVPGDGPPLPAPAGSPRGPPGPTRRRDPGPGPAGLRAAVRKHPRPTGGVGRAGGVGRLPRATRARPGPGPESTGSEPPGRHLDALHPRTGPDPSDRGVPTMRRPAALAFLVIASAAVGSSAAEESRNLLLNPGAESGRGDSPSVWVAARGPGQREGLTMRRSTDQAHSGRASLAIRFDGPDPAGNPIAFNWAQTLAEPPVGRTIRVRAWIKAEGADAANVCVQCWGDKDEMLAFGSTPVFRGDQDWAEARGGPVVVPTGTARVVVRAALTGRGRAWFDDLAVVEDGRTSIARADLEARAASQRAATASRDDVVTGIDDALTRLAGGRIVRALPVAKDCTILAYLSSWDHGRVDWVAVANNNNGARGGVRTLIGLPELKAEDVAADDRKFVLALYSRKTTSGDAPSPIEAVELTSGWAESTSWDDAPDVASSPFASAVLAPGEGWKLFDVTPLVRKGASSVTKGRGLALRFAREDVGTGGKWSGYEFVSREGQPGRRPMLLVIEPAK